jgi:hypothetical protein
VRLVIDYPNAPAGFPLLTSFGYAQQYLKTRAHLFDPCTLLAIAASSSWVAEPLSPFSAAATVSVHHGRPCASSDTVYFTTADDQGLSLISG